MEAQNKNSFEKCVLVDKNHFFILKAILWSKTANANDFNGALKFDSIKNASFLGHNQMFAENFLNNEFGNHSEDKLDWFSSKNAKTIEQKIKNLNRWCHRIIVKVCLDKGLKCREAISKPHKNQQGYIICLHNRYYLSTRKYFSFLPREMSKYSYISYCSLHIPIILQCVFIFLLFFVN